MFTPREHVAQYYHRIMDDENYIYEEGYFERLCEQIGSLDPKAADFEFVFANIRATISHTSFLTEAQRKKARQMLHLVQMQK